MDYSPQIWKRFRKPRYAGTLDGSDVVCGESGTPASKAVLCLQLKLAEGRVQAARFQALGCPSTIAAADWLCERLEGRVFSEAKLLNAGEITEALGLAPVRRHCAVLAEDALHAALGESVV